MIDGVITIDYHLHVCFDVVKHLLFLLLTLLRKDEVHVQNFILVILESVHFIIELCMCVLIESLSWEEIITYLDTAGEMFNKL
jgi:hypothetical protein